MAKVKSKYKGEYTKNIFYKELMALDRYYQYKAERSKVFRQKLSFPEKRFNARLKNRIESLSKLTQKIVSDPKKGGVLFVGPMYQLLFDSYKDLIDEVEGFTPKNKPKSYLDGFKKVCLA